MDTKKDAAISTRFLENVLRGIRHDLGAPVRHLVNFSQMLNELNDLPLQDKHRQWLFYIQQGSTQLQDMLHSLTTLTELCQQREASEVDLRDLFLQVYQECSKGEEVVLDISSHWPRVKVCKNHWQQLFLNLVSNALLFHPTKAQHIKHLKVRCEQHAQLVFTIEDNGIGVSESNRGEIRRAFKRLHDTQEYSGFGMGLSYCDLIAELNHATLAFSDSPLGGLCVTYSQPYR